MRFTADHAFHIGSQHLRGGMPCQDYALSGSVAYGAYAVISDGCSSGRHTDVGARVVAINTVAALTWTAPAYFAEHAVDKYCKVTDDFTRGALGLEQQDMLATCGYVAVTRNHIALRLVGDGVIAAKRRDGSLVMTKVDWDDNMPLYRAYADDNYFRFIQSHGDRGALAATVTRKTLDADGTEAEKVMPQPLYEMLSGFGDSVSIGDFEFVAVFSDGVDQVHGIAWPAVIGELMSFKSTEGRFVTRRMNRFLKDCLNRGAGPIDDISMACIHIDHEAT